MGLRLFLIEPLVPPHFYHPFLLCRTLGAEWQEPWGFPPIDMAGWVTGLCGLLPFPLDYADQTSPKPAHRRDEFPYNITNVNAGENGVWESFSEQLQGLVLDQS